MPNNVATRLDDVFRALADGTRRRVVHRLAAGPATVSELAAPFDMALPSFVQHLRVLEQAGLVRSEKRGRVRTCEIIPDALESAESWIAGRRRYWQERLDALETYLDQDRSNMGDPVQPASPPRPKEDDK